jgi:hypothetical protein
MRNPIHSAAKAAALLLLLALGACAGTSDLMRNVPPEKATYAPKPDQALIVFMRPSGFGFAIQSSVFDVTDGNPDFIAVLPAKAKVAHYSKPGQRRFMVIGESADFMDATLDPGKVYYALVTPRMGLWKARFSLRAVDGATVRTTEFDDWFKDSRWVENEPGAAHWAKANMDSIKEKMADDLDDWTHKPDKPTLHAKDGQPAMYVPKPEN